MDFSELPDHERLLIGLRFRLKHVRLAIETVESGHVPDGFDFAPNETEQTMLTELRRIEAEVKGMLQRNGGDESGRLN